MNKLIFLLCAIFFVGNILFAQEKFKIRRYYPSGQKSCENEAIIVGQDTVPNGILRTWRKDGTLLQRAVLNFGELDTLQWLSEKDSLERIFVWRNKELYSILNCYPIFYPRAPTVKYMKAVLRKDSVSISILDSVKRCNDNFNTVKRVDSFLLKDKQNQKVLVRLSIPDTNWRTFQSSAVNIDCRNFIEPVEPIIECEMEFP
jgi:hypothetical protein